MDALAGKVGGYVRRLTSHPDRHVGGPGNLDATAMFADAARGFGFQVACTAFPCLEWDHGEATLLAGGEQYALHVGPYSLPCDVFAPLVAASSAEELETAAIAGAVVLLHGDIARGQLMPKKFTFYNPESHKRVIRALEGGAPAAVIAATGRDPQLVGGIYPFPLFEDGDFDIPNAYTTDVEGERLVLHAGADVALRIDSRRLPATAEHVVATLGGDAPGRIVVFAHIDSRRGSPGALDNASGVAALLGMMELLADRADGPTVEVVPFNGEDDYANPGEMLWVAANEGRFEDIILGINVDDAGGIGQDTHVSFYGVPEGLAGVVRGAMGGRPGFAEGPQWFQSDHAILGLYGRPAIALASAGMHEFMATCAHTERDTIELADAEAIAGIARLLADVVEAVGAGR